MVAIDTAYSLQWSVVIAKYYHLFVN